MATLTGNIYDSLEEDRRESYESSAFLPNFGIWVKTTIAAEAHLPVTDPIREQQVIE
jgi:hypothetical protein